MAARVEGRRNAVVSEASNTASARMTRGGPLFLLVCALGAAPYAFPALSFWPVLGLLVLMALTPPKPHRRAAKPSKGKRTFDSS